MVFRFIIIVWGLSFLACQSGQEVSDGGISEGIFQELKSDATGIDFANNLEFQSDLNIVDYLYYYNGGGVAIGDLNGDGLEDIYLTGNQTADRIYKNKGNLQFEDVTAISGIDQRATWSTGVTMADVNLDGLLDIYVCKVNHKNAQVHNLLYINKGDFRFEEVSEAMGLDFSGYSTQATFIDYDRDGDLDMYLANHSVHTVRSYGTIEKRKERVALYGDVFYENRLNEAEAKFVDVSEAVGIYGSALGYALCIVATDINNDGWMDIYVGNDFHENDYLYINNGNKTFTESIKDYTAHTSKFTMGVDALDMNNDGRIDLFTTDMLPYDPSIIMKSAGEESNQIQNIKRDFGFEDQYARNHFQLQRTKNRFDDVAVMTDTYASDWSWSVLLQDFDNNGWGDVFITNGIVKRPNDLDYINYLDEVSFDGLDEEQALALKKTLIEKMPTLKIPNKLYLNTAEAEMERYKEMNVGVESYANGAAYSDLDNDGDLDLVVNNLNATASVFENRSEGYNQVSIQLQGSAASPNIIGSKCILYMEGQQMKRELTSSRGFQSSSTPIIHFGLGTITRIDSLAVIWPDGASQVEYPKEVNKRIVIKRGEVSDSYTHKLETADDERYTLEVLPLRHNENTFLDYDREFLIPELLSREGPAMLHIDLNGDGRKDIFLGGAMGQESGLYLLQADGSYAKASIESFRRDARYEDIAAAAFDFDADGDLDLYVVSGGGVGRELDKHLEDRIYINMGQGDFIRYPLSLPHTNGSCVATGDFDNDGYEDIFVGSRSIPGAYGLSPYSFVLRNVGGERVDIMLKERLGMITDVRIVDVDLDNNLDIVTAGDWMPITVLLNKGDGQFEESTSRMGLGETSGFWNTIEVVDIDGDGDLDIVGGNIGENSLLRATVEAPLTLYLHDFDQNGQVDPVIFKYQRGEMIPLATKDQLVKQIPSLKKKYSGYADFAKVRDVTSLTGVAEQDILETKKVQETRSMLFINERGFYQAHPLPKTAQLSDINNFLIEDHNSTVTGIKYVGNRRDYSAEIGANTSNGGGELKGYSPATHTFSICNSLGLPSKLSYRSIVEYHTDDYLITTNNDYLYILREIDIE